MAGPARRGRRCSARPATAEPFAAAAARRSWQPPRRGRHNAFKVELAQRAIVRALTDGDDRGGAHERRRSAGAVDRVDGPAKVTGAARYTAEIALPGLAYAVIVGATVASGRVIGDRRRARPSAPTACWRC